MGHQFVHKISSLFPSSFTSCQFRNVPDVVESSISIPKSSTKIFHDSETTAFTRTYKNPSLSKPKEPKIPRNETKVPNQYCKKILLFAGSDTEGRRCPPVTPISVLANSELKVKLACKDSSKINNLLSSSSNSGLFSSTDDQKADVDGELSDAFFSLSSCSSKSFRQMRIFDLKQSNELGRCSSGLSAKSANSDLFSQCSLKTTKNPSEKHKISDRNPSKNGKIWHKRENHKQSQFVINREVLKGCEVVEASTELYYGDSGTRKTAKTRLKTGKTRRRRNKETGPDFVDDRLEESYAVEKSSSDPQGDFRTSMVEMILEKQIFGAKDLERLLYCFLSLNSPYYHKIIVKVFTEICDTLFST